MALNGLDICRLGCFLNVYYDAFLHGIAVVVDVLWGQPIKLIQVAFNSELCENQWNDLFSLKLFPLIASGPQKCKHKIGHNYFIFQHPKKLRAFF